MGIPLISPLLWRAVPYDDPDAFDDFNGSHEQWHRELAKVTNTRALTLDDLQAQMDVHGRMHHDVATALGISPVGDLTNFDLTERDAFDTFMLIHGEDHQRLRLAAGL